MRVLLLGAGGMLGRDLAASAPDGVSLTALSRSELDLTDHAAVDRRVAELRPRWVVNAAAYTHVDRAESEPLSAMAVNADAVRELAASCARHGAALAHFSTDYVFSGEGPRPYGEDDATAPLGVYGRSKLAGEEAVRASGAEHLILRTQWLFGLHGRSFPRTMWERAVHRRPTRVVADQYGRPTATSDLAAATWQLLGGPFRGTLHVTNEGEVTSWLEIARLVFAAARAEHLLSPCSSADYPTAARRPAHAVLDTARLLGRTGVRLRPWPVALADFLRVVA